MTGGGLEWSLSAPDRERILSLLDGMKEPEVVELGAGEGTLALARGVAERDGALTSVEHDPAWVERVTGDLHDGGLAATARVIHAPLQPHPLAEPGSPGTRRLRCSSCPSASTSCWSTGRRRARPERS